MKRITTIGLVLLAALALTGALASAASASQFRAQRYPTTINASQGVAQKLTMGSPGVNFKCANSTATGTEASPSSSLEVAPSFTSCSLGGLSATVASNGCRLVYKSSNESAPLVGTFGIACGTGSTIEIKQSENCLVSIPAQANLPGVEFSDSGSGASSTITVTYNVTGLSGTGSGSGCPTGLKGSFSNGSLTGSSLLKGSTGLRSSGIYLGNEQSVEGPQFTGGSYPLTLKSAPATTFKWSINGSEFKCTTVIANATLASQSSEIDQALEIAGCTGSGLTIPVSMNGCMFDDYVTGIEGTKLVGGREIACPSGREITLQWGTCTWAFPAQNIPGSGSFINAEEGGLKTVQANYSLTGLHYAGSAGCPNGTVGPHETGGLTTSWTLKGYELGVKQKSIWIQ